MAGQARGVSHRPKRMSKMPARYTTPLYPGRSRGSPPPEARQASPEDSSRSSSSSSSSSSDEEGSPPSPKRQKTRQATPEASTAARHANGQSGNGHQQRQSETSASCADVSHPASRAQTPASEVAQRPGGPGSLPRVRITRAAWVAERPGAIAAVVCAATLNPSVRRDADGGASADAHATQPEAAGAAAKRADPAWVAGAGGSDPCALLTPEQWEVVEQRLDDPTVNVQSTADAFRVSLEYLNATAHKQMKQPGLHGLALKHALVRAFRIKDALEDHLQRCERAGRCSVSHQASTAAAVAEPAQRPAAAPLTGLLPPSDQGQSACGPGVDAAAFSQAQLPVHTTVAAATAVPMQSPSDSPSAAATADVAAPGRFCNPAAAPEAALESGHAGDDAAAGGSAPAAAKMPARGVSASSWWLARAKEAERRRYAKETRDKWLRRVRRHAVASLAAALSGPRQDVDDGLACGFPELAEPASGGAASGKPESARPPSAGTASAAGLAAASALSPPAGLDADKDPPDYVPDSECSDGLLGSVTSHGAASVPAFQPFSDALPRYVLDSRCHYDVLAAAATSLAREAWWLCVVLSCQRTHMRFLSSCVLHHVCLLLADGHCAYPIRHRVCHWSAKCPCIAIWMSCIDIETGPTTCSCTT